MIFESTHKGARFYRIVPLCKHNYVATLFEGFVINITGHPKGFHEGILRRYVAQFALEKNVVNIPVDICFEDSTIYFGRAYAVLLQRHLSSEATDLKKCW
jgi:hypothetical protein